MATNNNQPQQLPETWIPDSGISERPLSGGWDGLIMTATHQQVEVPVVNLVVNNNNRQINSTSGSYYRKTVIFVPAI